jgi:excinuclease UvrABC nuclease subunit
MDELEDFRIPPSWTTRYGIPEDGRFILYQHCDHEGRAIYIGKSRCVRQRTRTHRVRSSWWNEVNYIEYELFGTAAELTRAEIAAIRRFRPKYNVAHNDPAMA